MWSSGKTSTLAATWKAMLLAGLILVPIRVASGQSVPEGSTTQDSAGRRSSLSSNAHEASQQSVPPAAPAADKNAQEPVPINETVVVTARKRSENVQDTPMPVTVLNSKDLFNTQAVKLEDFYPRVPGLVINSQGDGRIALTIRGLSVGQTPRAPIATIVDDIPVTPTGSSGVIANIAPDIDPSVLQGVEVLRGPQGTLYGASTLGGLLKYTTTDPGLNVLHYSIATDVNTVAGGGIGRGLRGAVNLPLVQNVLALSASGSYRRDAGFITDRTTGDDEFNRSDVYAGRLAMSWWLSDNVDLRLSYLRNSQHLNGPARLATDVNLRPISGDLQNSFLRGSGEGDITANIASAKLRARLNGVTFESITGYVQDAYTAWWDRGSARYPGAVTRFGVAGVNQYFDHEARKFTQEIRLGRDVGGRVNWLAGTFYTDEDILSIQTRYAADEATGALAGIWQQFDFPGQFREIAGFADIIIKATDALSVEVGGRIASIRQRYNETDTGAALTTPFIVISTSQETPTTWQFVPQYRVRANTLLYGRVATGYRPGGPQNAIVDDPRAPRQVDADTTINYEVGLKGSIFSKRASYDASLFYIDWKDIQVTQRLEPVGSFIFNAGAAKITGVELSGNATLGPFLVLSGNMAYTDAQLTTTIGKGFPGVAGDILPYSAKWVASGSLEGSRRLTRSTDLFYGALVSYVGDRKDVFPSSVSYVRQTFPGYRTVDLRAGIAQSDRWRLTVYGKNLGNTRGVLFSASRYDTPTPTAVFDTTIIAPRTIGVSLSRSF